jgi:hypothetical protein
MGSVGPFFYVKERLLAECTDIDQAEVYGDFKTGKSSHFDLWDAKYYKLFRKPYDYFPRGRVVYNYRESKYIVYADKCIQAQGIDVIIDTFGIRDENIVIDKTDQHYVCKGCNKNYFEYPF